jgi:protein tyrosine phosphatase
MIYERNCAVVVMTSDLVEGGQEASTQYWPDSGTAHYGEFAVDLLGEEKLEGFTVRSLSITDTKANIHHVIQALNHTSAVCTTKHNN